MCELSTGQPDPGGLLLRSTPAAHRLGFGFMIAPTPPGVARLRLLLVRCLLGGLVFTSAFAAGHGRLQTTANHRYLEFEDGTPFFYLGDTAWTLLNRATRVEADRYLANRAANGFTVIQAVVLAPEGGLTVPNANGDLPLIEQDLARPNEAYFLHVDAIVNRASELGLFIGLLPAWGNYWRQGGRTEASLFTADNAAGFGRFLGRRY
jgi:hypothetical protein